MTAANEVSTCSVLTDINLSIIRGRNPSVLADSKKKELFGLRFCRALE